MSRAVRVDGISPEAKSISVVVTFPVGTVLDRRWTPAGPGAERVYGCCDARFSCDTRTSEQREKILEREVAIEVEVSEEALRDVAWRALVSKGGKGTAGGMVSRRRGPVASSSRVVETRPHVRKLPTRDELVDQARTRGLNLERGAGGDGALCPACAAVNPELALAGFSEAACYNCDAKATGRIQAARS